MIETNPITSSFFRKWFLSTLYGWLMGFAALILVAVTLESLGLPNFQFFVGSCIGIGVGYMQGRLLNHFYDVGLQWMWATFLGLGSSFIIFELGINRIPYLSDWNMYLAVIVGGLLIGIFQFLIMRRKYLRAKWWILFSLLIWSASISSLLVNDYVKDWGFIMQVVGIILFVFGPPVILGFASAFCLKWVMTGGEKPGKD